MKATSTMTLSEFLVKDPHLYDSAVTYFFNTSTNEWDTTSIDTATKNLLYEEFCDRYVCNDKTFKRRFVMHINDISLRYAQLLRNELTAFDPMVADYMEKQIISNASKQAVGSSSLTGNGSDSTTTTDSRTRTPDLEESVSGSTSHDSDRTTGGSDSTSTSGSSDSKHVEMSKVAPQSISYICGGSGGHLPTLDWQYATSQAQAEDAGNTSGSSSTTHGMTEGIDESGSENRTTTQTGTETISGNGSASKITSKSESGSTSSTETGSNESKEMISGRNGLTPQEALSKANAYIKNSDAAEWFKRQLQCCFRCVSYDPADEVLY